MHSVMDDYEQAEYCREWSRKKMQKKMKRARHWRNCKVYVSCAWYEFRAMMRGR